MKQFIFFVLLAPTAFANSFSEDAPRVAEALKKNLMGNLQRELKDNGTIKAIDFCHTEVKVLGSKTSAEFKDKYTFGRTSHKVRNPKNAPENWVGNYLNKFQNKKQGQEGTGPFFHKLDGKEVYLEPLWVAPMCLQCHGDNVAQNVKSEILKRYPNDKAQGFKVGDFRGFIWVKEK